MEHKYHCKQCNEDFYIEGLADINRKCRKCAAFLFLFDGFEEKESIEGID